MRRALAALFAGAALGFLVTAGAAPFGIQLGHTRLILDTPSGFSDTAGYGSPRLTEIAENLAEASNRVLVFALSDADTRRFSAGDSLELRRYLLAVTPRATERERASETQFSALTREATRGFSEPPSAAGSASVDFMRFLQTRPAGQANLLAELRRETGTLSLLLGTMVPQPPATFWRDAPPPLFKLSTTTLALIGGRTLYISAFTAYDTPEDVAWITSITDRWVRELQRLNR